MADDESESGSDGKSKPLLEWAAALVGLVLTLTLLGFVGWQAVQAPEKRPPAVSVMAGWVSQVPGGYVVEVTAKNRSTSTAAGVEVEGTITRGGAKIASSVTFDYVPGHSERKGGLFFPQDPRAHPFEVRALGYSQP